MEKKKLIPLGLLFILLIILMVIFFRSGGKEKIKPLPVASSYELGPQAKESQEMKKIVLFFLSEKDELLHPEEREIHAGTSLVLQARQAMMELMGGSQNGYISPFPLETKLRELFITGDGIAYVDFSKELQEGHPLGSSAEILTIFSIVDTLTYNFKAIKRVFILLDGRERETLGGHIDLSRPFLPQYDFIAKR